MRKEILFPHDPEPLLSIRTRSDAEDVIQAQLNFFHTNSP